MIKIYFQIGPNETQILESGALKTDISINISISSLFQ